MMHDVTAPDGWQGCVYYDDGARSWQAAARRIGDNWWTNCGYKFGSAHTQLTDVLATAAGFVVQFAARGF